MLRLEPPENVNLCKLTKLEKKVLAALSKQRVERMFHYPEGNDITGIAKLVYGEEVLDCARRGGHHCSDVSLCFAAKSSLSRTLNRLYQTGLVKKCKPIRHYGWFKRNNELDRGGFYGILWKFLKTVSINEKGLFVVEKLNFKDLPWKCHVWWMLTDRGRKLAEKQGEVE